MASSTRRNLVALVISLAFMVISLPVTSLALAPPPEVNPRLIMTVTDGLKAPAGVALDAEGNIYVTDPVKRGVVMFNKYAKQVMFFKTEGLPQRVAVSSNGNGSVLVSQGAFVAEYNNNGLESFRLRQGSQPFPFKCATGIAVHPVNGNVYVADAGANKIFVFDPSGSYTGLSFGDNWRDPSNTSVVHNLGLPADLLITDEWINNVRTNRVFVVDTRPRYVLGDNFAMQIPVFTDAGVYIKSLCDVGEGAGPNGICALSFPMGLAIEYTAGSNPSLYRLYATDPYQASMVVFDDAQLSGSSTKYGNFISFLGSYGSAPGELVVPTGVVFDKVNKRLIVANGYGNLTFYPLVGGKNPVSRDSILPIFDINPLSANNVSTSAITITGTREASDVKVVVSANTTAIPGATTYPSSTQWRCDLTGLAEGRNDIVVTGRDDAGNIQSKSITVYYTKPLTEGFVVNPWPEITKNTEYNFTGTRPSGALVVTSPVSTCTYNGDLWSCPVPLQVEGNNTVTFTVNTKVTTANIIRDTTTPTLQVFALGSGDATSAQVQNISGVVTDANLKKLTVKVNSGSAREIAVSKEVFNLAASQAAFSFPIVLDRAGENTVVVEAEDKVGNLTTDTRTVSLNMAAPNVTVATPTDGKAMRTSVLNLSGTVDQVAANCTVNGGSTNINNNGSLVGSVTLTTGFNNIIVACTSSGQTSKVKRTIFYNPDILELAVAAPTRDKSTNASSITIQGTVDTATDTLLSTINGETRAVPIDNGSYSFTASLPVEGSYSYLLTAVDGTGSYSSTITRSVVADTTPPAVSVNYGLTNTGTITGGVEPGAKVEIKDSNDVSIGTVTLGADVSGNGTFTATLGQNYDLFSLVVAATDQAGNVTTIGAAKPDGDCSRNGAVAADDASICLDLVAGLREPTSIERAHCDVGPLKDGLVSPNGQMDISDCISVMRKASGLPPVWW